MLTAWSDTTLEPITIKKLISLSEEQEKLKDILSDLAGGKEGINSKKLSNFLRKVKNRWEDGKCIIEAGKTREKTGLWRVNINLSHSVSSLSKKK